MSLDQDDLTIIKNKIYLTQQPPMSKSTTSD